MGDWTFRTVEDGRFRLDGGSMFGVVPRVMWEKHHKPDEFNRIEMTLRCLLVEHGDRRILVDTGIGDRWDEKYLASSPSTANPPSSCTSCTSWAWAPKRSPTSCSPSALDHTGHGARRDLVSTVSRGHALGAAEALAMGPPATERDKASFRIDDFTCSKTAACCA